MTAFIIIVTIVVCVVIYLRYKIASATPPTPSKAAAASNNLAYLPPQFVVLDIETTGLDSNTHEIIEIAAILVNRDSNNHQFWTTLVKPQKKIPVNITEITGITQEMVNKDGVSLEEAIIGFVNFVGDRRLVAYNAPFDLAFLNIAAARFGRKISNPVSDALSMARRAWPGLRSHSLKNVAQQGNLNTDGMHRALEDCKLALTVYTSAVNELRTVS